MVNKNRLHSFDEESLHIIESIPKQKRSDFVREAVKNYHRLVINAELEEEKPKISKKPQKVRVEYVS